MNPATRSLTTPMLLRTSWLIPAMVLLTGLAATYGLHRLAQANNRSEVAAHFQSRMDGLVHDIEGRLRSHEQILRGARALLAASDEVRRDEFHEYAVQMHLSERYPGISTLGYAVMLAPGTVQAFQDQVRAQGMADFSVYSAEPEPPRTALLYLEPLNESTRSRLGLDLSADARLYAAMEAARDDDQITEARPSDGSAADGGAGRQRGEPPALAWFLPVYSTAQAYTSVAERRRNLRGWIVAQFQMSALMAGIIDQHFGETSPALAFRIYDSDTQSADALLYDSWLAAGGHAQDLIPAFQATAVIEQAGRPWTIIARSLPGFEARLPGQAAWFITVIGTACSLFSAIIAWLLTTGQRRAHREARRLARRYHAEGMRTLRLNRALRLLGACNVALIRADDEQRLLDDICHLLVRQGNYDVAWVAYALHDEASTVRIAAHDGLHDDHHRFPRMSWADVAEGQWPCGTAIRSCQTVLIQDYDKASGIRPWEAFAHEHEFRSSIALPLVGHAGVLGALGIYSRDAHAFNEEEVRLLEDLAADLSYGIEALHVRARHDSAMEQLAFLAYHDPLTQLPNRLQLMRFFEEAQSGGGDAHVTMALLFLGLDNFKQVNDLLGHEQSDRLLILAVQRLQARLPEADILGRYRGDQFIVLTGTGQGRAAAEYCAQALLAACAEPFQIEGHVLQISFSIGISMFPEDGGVFDLLIKNADAAMRRAKDKGRNTFEFSAGGISSQVIEDTQLQGWLRLALDHDELILHYQPQVDALSGRVLGFEALLRWNHPDRGLISPARFIPLAERNGMIIPIGEWVLRQATRQAGIWHAQGHPVLIAVNLSALQFRRGNLPEIVEEALADADLPARLLDLELTESILLQDFDIVGDTLQALKRMGVRLSIDDFGTGYSSLSYLKRLKVDKLKIDQSFVADLLSNTESAAITRAVIQLAHALQLEVIAEGVEQPEQARWLGRYGCHQLQGYYFSRPVCAQEASDLIGRDFRSLETI